MKAEITHEQTVTIPADVRDKAVDIAADSAMLVAVKAQKEAASDTVKAALKADKDYIEAKKIRKEVRENAKVRDSAKIEEAEALEAKAKDNLADTTAWKLLQSSTMLEAKIRRAIDRKIGEVGQLLLPLYREDEDRHE